MKKTSIIPCLALLLALSIFPGVSGESISIQPQSSEGVAGEIMEMTIMVDRIPEGLSGYNITVTVEDPQVAEIVNVSYPEWATISYIFPAPPAGHVSMTASDLMDAICPGDTRTDLGYLSIRGLNEGKTAIKIEVNRLNTDSGDDINAILSGAFITVTSGSVPAGSGNAGGGGGGGGAGIFGSSITLTSTTAPTASHTSVEAADSSAPSSPPTTIAKNTVTASQSEAGGTGGGHYAPAKTESSTGEEDFPWIIIAGAIVAVVLAGLAAIGYNKSREKS